MLVFHRTPADLLCGLIGLLFLLRSKVQKQWGWLRDPVILTLFAAWAWLLLVVTPFAYDTPASASLALPWIRFILFYAGMRHWVLTEAQPIKAIGITLGILLALITVDTLWQYVYGISLSNNFTAESGRLTGPFGNVKVGIYMARMVLPATALCLFFSLQETKTKLALSTFGGLYFLILITIAVSGERAPFGLTFLGTLVTLSILMVTERKLRKLCLWIMAGVIGAVYLLVTTQQWVQDRLMHMFVLLQDWAHSSYGQLFWMAYDMGMHHPLTGVGLKNFRELCYDYLAAGTVTHCNLHAHNPYLEWFGEAGVVGLVLFCVFVFLLMRQCIRVLRRCSGLQRLIPAFAIGALLVQFFPLVPTQSFFANWPAILFWYSLSLTMGSLTLCEKPESGAVAS